MNEMNIVLYLYV